MISLAPARFSCTSAYNAPLQCRYPKNKEDVRRAYAMITTLIARPVSKQPKDNFYIVLSVYL